MILFFGEGRLGNQIFQYAFLKSIASKDEKIVVSGFDEFLEVFEEDISLIHLSTNNRYTRFFIYKILAPKILEPLAKRGVFAYTKQDVLQYGTYAIPTKTLTTKKGAFPNVQFIQLAFFQSKLFFKKAIVDQLQIKKSYRLKSEKFIEPIKKSYKVFVHIRRKDYLEWTILGKTDLTLPLEYFKNQIDWFSTNKKNVVFIFLSDDTSYIYKEFEYLKNKIISESNDVGCDLAIMTQCEGAIISNSSLSWWGSYLMKNRDKVFAPKHWLGFKSQVWFPEGIELEETEYIKI